MTRTVTVTGIEIDLLHPTPEMISISDIARGLGQTSRYCGQVWTPYSVLQHSLLVAEIVEAMGFPHFKLHALLHDAAEAYTGDAWVPLKEAMRCVRSQQQVSIAHDIVMSDFDLIAERLDHAIQSKFGLMTPLGWDAPLGMDQVGAADRLVYIYEVPRVLPPGRLQHPLWSWVKDIPRPDFSAEAVAKIERCFRSDLSDPDWEHEFLAAFGNAQSAWLEWRNANVHRPGGKSA